jgi:hypothetical protein
VTLGIFSAWAKVRNKRYFLGNTYLIQILKYSPALPSKRIALRADAPGANGAWSSRMSIGTPQPENHAILTPSGARVYRNNSRISPGR